MRNVAPLVVMMAALDQMLCGASIIPHPKKMMVQNHRLSQNSCFCGSCGNGWHNHIH